MIRRTIRPEWASSHFYCTGMIHPMWMLVHFVRGTSLAYVPVCHHDLFISYASESNREGWVEQFANVLGQELADLLGRQFVPKDSVFLDKRELEVAQSFPVRLTAAARASAILVPEIGRASCRERAQM